MKNFINNRKIAITGGTGFLGKCIIQKLLQYDAEIYCFVREGSNVVKLPNSEKIKIVTVDFSNTNSLKEHLRDISVVIHLIGQLGKYGIDYQTFYETNVIITKNMIQACSKSLVEQFIFCSTPGVQGFGRRLANENDAYNPRNDYEKTKMLAEQFIIRYCTDKELNYTILRPDFVYGPGDYRRVQMYKNIRDRKFVLTTNGLSYLHPTYIDDIADGFLKSIGNIDAYKEIFNLSALEDVTVLVYLNSIAKATESRLIKFNIGYKASIILASIIEIISKKFFNKEGFVSKNKIDFLALDHSTSNQKARDILGYHPIYPINEGMEKTIEWCKHSNLL